MDLPVDTGEIMPAEGFSEQIDRYVRRFEILHRTLCEQGNAHALFDEINDIVCIMTGIGHFRLEP